MGDNHTEAPLPEDRIYLREAADILGRRMGTIRKWESSGVLPEELHPHRDETGRRWRYFTNEQIDGIKAWIVDTDRRPGKGLPTYDPDEEQVQRQIERMRGPRK